MTWSSRRRFLAAAASTVVTASAGCLLSETTGDSYAVTIQPVAAYQPRYLQSVDLVEVEDPMRSPDFVLRFDVREAAPSLLVARELGSDVRVKGDLVDDYTILKVHGPDLAVELRGDAEGKPMQRYRVHIESAERRTVTGGWRTPVRATSTTTGKVDY